MRKYGRIGFGETASGLVTPGRCVLPAGRPRRRWLAALVVLLLTGPPATADASHGPGWANVTPAGLAPAARYDGASATAYDDHHDRLIFFGGDYAGSLPRPTETWIFENATGRKGVPAWTQLTTSGGPPPDRIYTSLVYDPADNRAILHGGCTANCSPARADTWVLTNANGLGGQPQWSSLPSAPVARAGQVAGYDPASNRMVVFGGHQAFPQTDRNDVWILKDANGIGSPAWEQLSPTGPLPPPRGEAASGAYDPASNKLFIMGGFAAGTANPIYNDVWVLSNANGLGGTPTWAQISPDPPLPNPRGFHAVGYDSATNNLVISGGWSAGFAALNDTWTLSNADGGAGAPRWRELQSTTLPPARAGARSALSSVDGHLVIAMGRDDAQTPPWLTDVWVLDARDGVANAILTATVGPHLEIAGGGATFGTILPTIRGRSYSSAARLQVTTSDPSGVAVRVAPSTAIRNLGIPGASVWAASSATPSVFEPLNPPGVQVVQSPGPVNRTYKVSYRLDIAPGTVLRAGDSYSQPITYTATPTVP